MGNPIINLNSNTAQIVTLIGVILSFFVGTAGLLIGIKNSRKTIFINSVTNSRIKYIQDLRNSVAEFCGLFYRFKVIQSYDELLTERLRILESCDKLKYLVRLYLNPEDKEWDKKIIDLIDEVRQSADYSEEKINNLIIITQYLLKIEWERAKLESRKGVLSKKVKNNLNKKYLCLYEENIKRKP